MDSELMIRPEVEQRLRELAEAEQRYKEQIAEAAIEGYMNRAQRREELVRLLRRIEEENADFYRELGDL
jgi:predicted transcriptional regulator